MFERLYKKATTASAVATRAALSRPVDIWKEVCSKVSAGLNLLEKLVLVSMQRYNGGNAFAIDLARRRGVAAAILPSFYAFFESFVLTATTDKRLSRDLLSHIRLRETFVAADLERVLVSLVENEYLKPTWAITTVRCQLRRI
jgi:hypothetical protein